MKNETKIYITLFYADWCGHCIRFKPDWEKLKNVVESGEIKNKLDDENIKVFFDQVESQNQEAMKQNEIKSYPTIKVCILQNGPAEKYDVNSNDRELNRFVDVTLKYVSQQLRKSIKNKLNDNKNPNQNGGYFNYVKPDLKYYHKYLKYKSKYLSLKNN